MSIVRQRPIYNDADEIVKDYPIKKEDTPIQQLVKSMRRVRSIRNTVYLAASEGFIDYDVSREVQTKANIRLNLLADDGIKLIQTVDDVCKLANELRRI